MAFGEQFYCFASQLAICKLPCYTPLIILLEGASLRFFIIANFTVHDPDKFRKYSSLVGPILTHFGGRIRMGAFDVSQSTTTPPSGSVVVEFNDPESAQRFFTSSDYAEAKDLFIASTQPDIVFAVETMA